VWWSAALSVDPACRIYAGAERKTWKELSGASDEDVADEPDDSWFGILTQSIERAAKTRFGALVSCTERGLAEDSPGSRVSVVIERDENVGRDGKTSQMTLVLSPELAAALGEDADGVADEAASSVEIDAPIAMTSLELLKHVEVPVSVSFGRTQMRLKDLLGLANGSVVQLDRELGDEVELRVNNRVIARGEVVAVDGNYGVRILRMTPDETASGQGGQGLRTALRAG
jgi:flagellar motor switch protein FliN/FliY